VRDLCRRPASAPPPVEANALAAAAQPPARPPAAPTADCSPPAPHRTVPPLSRRFLNSPNTKKSKIITIKFEEKCFSDPRVPT
jgi:hypothetical protein